MTLSLRQPVHNTCLAYLPPMSQHPLSQASFLVLNSCLASIKLVLNQLISIANLLSQRNSCSPCNRLPFPLSSPFDFKTQLLQIRFPDNFECNILYGPCPTVHTKCPTPY